MMQKKYKIIACNRVTGQTEGFIKSVSYKNQTFKLTTDVNEAKMYTSADKIQGEIDDLTLYSRGNYVFLIN